MKFVPSEIKIIVTLQNLGKLSRKNVASKCGISEKNISKYLKPLLAKNLLIIEKIKKGKQYYHLVSLTSKGERLTFEKIPEIKPKKIKPKPKKIDTRKIRIKKLEKELSLLRQIPAREEPKVKQLIREKVKEITKIEREPKPKIPIKLPTEPRKPKLAIPEIRIIEPRKLPETSELKKELRLLIELVLTHRKEQYKKYGYKNVSEIRVQIQTLIDQL